MSTIVGVCGSLRSASFNMMLLRALAGAAPPGTTIEIASIREIPLFDGDLEASGGIADPVQRLKESIARSDGFLIVTLGHNNSMPGVLRTPSTDCHGHLPTSLVYSMAGPWRLPARHRTGRHQTRPSRMAPGRAHASGYCHGSRAC